MKKLPLHLATIAQNKWEGTGLLSGMDDIGKPQLCVFLNACANFMLGGDNMLKLNVGSYKFEYDLEVHMFPLIRRLFISNKLSYVHFIEKTELENYTNVVLAYVNDTEPVLVYNTFKELDNFIPNLILDYLQYHQLPQIRILKINKSIDIEEEILSQYTEEFDDNKLQHMINSPFRIQ